MSLIGLAAKALIAALTAVLKKLWTWTGAARKRGRQKLLARSHTAYLQRRIKAKESYHQLVDGVGASLNLPLPMANADERELLGVGAGELRVQLIGDKVAAAHFRIEISTHRGLVTVGPLSVYARSGHERYVVPVPGLPALDLVPTGDGILRTVDWYEIHARVEFADSTYVECRSPNFAPVYREHLQSTFIRIDDTIYNADMYENAKQELKIYLGSRFLLYYYPRTRPITVRLRWLGHLIGRTIATNRVTVWLVFWVLWHAKLIRLSEDGELQLGRKRRTTSCT